MDKYWIKQSDNRMLLFVLLLVFLNAIAFFVDARKLLQLVEPILFATILTIFFYKYPKTKFILISFLLFAIIGDISNLFQLKILDVKIEAIAYCLSYICLIYEAIYRIKKLKISLLIGAYLVLVFAVNAYFLYVFYDVLKETIINSLDLSFIIVRVLSLLLFSLFSFTLYLSNESRQTILLLLMSISFAFSDVLYLVTEYYMYYWIFDFISKILYVISFYFFYLYVKSNKNFSLARKNLEQSVV